MRGDFWQGRWARLGLAAACALIGAAAGAEEPPAAPARVGQKLVLDGRQAQVLRLEDLPCVDSEHTRRFRFVAIDNPKLAELRTRYGLDRLVGGTEAEFTRQLRLMDWVYRQFKAFGSPEPDLAREKDALVILRAAEANRPMFCAHMASVFVSAAASVGWVDRALALKRPANRGQGSDEHTTTEIWSNQHRKWVMLDPTHNQYMSKGGVPLSAMEIRQEWYSNDGNDLTIVMGKDGAWNRHTKADLPIFERRMLVYGNMSYQANSLHKYALIAWIPNTDLMDQGPQYDKAVYYEDDLCKDTPWHRKSFTRVGAEVPYFSINQAALSLRPSGADVEVTIRTLTPNFKEFQVGQDGGDWTPSAEKLTWKLRAGRNTLQVRSVNRSGVPGPVSTVELEVSAP